MIGDNGSRIAGAEAVGILAAPCAGLTRAPRAMPTSLAGVEAFRRWLIG
jgi:hypothetical protein